jgi:hypothetical protein
MVIQSLTNFCTISEISAIQQCPTHINIFGLLFFWSRVETPNERSLLWEPGAAPNSFIAPSSWLFVLVTILMYTHSYNVLHCIKCVTIIIPDHASSVNLVIPSRKQSSCPWNDLFLINAQGCRLLAQLSHDAFRLPPLLPLFTEDSRGTQIIQIYQVSLIIL